MSDEKIVIEITDKINPSIELKLNKIAIAAEIANSKLENLKIRNAIASERLFQAEAKSTIALDNMRSASTKLAIEQERLKVAKLSSSLASERLFQAEAKSTIALENLRSASEKLKLSQAKVGTEQVKTALTNQKLTNEQKKTEIQTRNLDKATSQAALSHLRLEQAQKRAALQAQNMGNSYSKIGNILKSALAFAGVAIGIQQIKDLSNAYTDLRNKLRVVSNSEEQLNEIQSRVFEIANRSRINVEDVATSFQRFDLALKPLGASQAEVLRMTETVSKAMILGGGSAQEATQSLRQLSQAFNKGKLDGDEFRTVMEAAPLLANALAIKLDVARGALLKLAPEGKITASIMRKAFANLAKDIDEKFSKTVPTLSQAITVFRNKWIETIGTIERESGVFSKISNFIISFANNIPTLSIALGGLASSISDLVSSIIDLTGQKTISGFEFLRRTIQGISFLFYGIGDAVKLAHWGILELSASTAQVFANIANLRSKLSFGDTSKQYEELRYQLEFVARDLKSQAEAVIEQKTGYDKWIENVEKAEEKLSKLSNTNLRLEGSTNQLTEATEGLTKAKIKTLYASTKLEESELQRLQTIPNLLLSLEDEVKLLSLTGDEQEIANRMLQIQNDLIKDGIELHAADLYFIEQKLRFIQELNRVNQERNRIEDETINKQKNFQAKISGFKSASGINTSNDASVKMSIFGDYFQGTDTAREAELEKLKEFYKRVDELQKANVMNAKEAEAAKYKAKLEYDKYYLDAANTFFGNLESLQSSGSEKVFNIGKAAALANATINGYETISNALAIKPYWVGVATAISAGISTAANISKIASTQFKGYASGGLISGGRQAIQVNENGNEFIMNSQATSKNRPILEAMNSGRTPNVGNSIIVNIENYGTGKIFDVQKVNEDEIRIIARDETRNVISKEIPKLVSGEIANPNSQISKSLNRNLSVVRKRD